MTPASLGSTISDLEDDIDAIRCMAQLLAALAGSRLDMPCAALGPLAIATLSHAEGLTATFSALHAMTGGQD